MQREFQLSSFGRFLISPNFIISLFFSHPPVSYSQLIFCGLRSQLRSSVRLAWLQRVRKSSATFIRALRYMPWLEKLAAWYVNFVHGGLQWVRIKALPVTCFAWVRWN